MKTKIFLFHAWRNLWLAGESFVVRHLGGAVLYGSCRVGRQQELTHVRLVVNAAEFVARRAEVRVLDEVEENRQHQEEDEGERDGDGNEDAFPACVPLAKRHVRQKDDGSQDAEHEAAEMRPVVEIRKRTDEKEDEEVNGQTDGLVQRLLDDCSHLNQLHALHGQQTGQGGRTSHL